MNSIKWEWKLLIKNRRSAGWIILTALIVLTSCSGFKRPAIGPHDLILVLSDQRTFDMHKFQLEKIFNDPIHAPMRENRFSIRRIGMDQFNEGSAKYRYLILLTNVDNSSPEASFIKRMLTESIMDGVREGKYYYAVKDDIWANDQTVLLLMDSRNIHLGGYLERFSDNLFRIFNDKMIETVKERLLETRFNNKKAQEFARKKYNFDVFVPHDFIVSEERTVPDIFVRFRRFNPDRWLTVLRTNYDTSMTFQDNIIKTRDRIGEQFGDSVRVNPEFLTFVPDTLFSPNGLMAKGIWEYAEGGGPFFTRAFLNNDVMYIIDGAVFAPGVKKYPFVIQLEIMSETVRFLELE